MSELPPMESFDPEPDDDFALELLNAIVAMANRSKRRQADLLPALKAARIEADVVRVRQALRRLEQLNAISTLIPLHDGSVLMTVANNPYAEMEADTRFWP